jgi:hypothetical protein
MRGTTASAAILALALASSGLAGAAAPAKNAAKPAQSAKPAASPAEIAALRKEVDELKTQISLLQQQMKAMQAFFMGQITQLKQGNPNSAAPNPAQAAPAATVKIAGEPSKGDKDAKLVLVDFSDYQ